MLMIITKASDNLVKIKEFNSDFWWQNLDLRKWHATANTTQGIGVWSFQFHIQWPELMHGYNWQVNAP